jgi:hypothetical protein
VTTLRLAHLDLALLATTNSVRTTNSSKVSVDTTGSFTSTAHLDISISVVISKNETAICVELGIALLFGAGPGVQETIARLGGGNIGQGVGGQQIQRVIFGRCLANVLSALALLPASSSLDTSLAAIDIDITGSIIRLVVGIGIRAVDSLIESVAGLLGTSLLFVFIVLVFIGTTLLLLALIALTLLTDIHNQLAIFLADKGLHERSTEASNQSVDDTLDLAAETTLVLLVPGHQVGHKCRQTRAQGLIRQDDNGNLYEAKNRTDDLTVVASKEELDGLDQIAKNLGFQFALVLEKEAGERSD